MYPLLRFRELLFQNLPIQQWIPTTVIKETTKESLQRQGSPFIRSHYIRRINQKTLWTYAITIQSANLRSEYELTSIVTTCPLTLGYSNYRRGKIDPNVTQGMHENRFPVRKLRYGWREENSKYPINSPNFYKGKRARSRKDTWKREIR